MAIKILTLNTWQESGPWEERWEVIYKGLKKLKPDIVAFQEVFNREWIETVQRQVGFPNLYFCDEPCGLVILSNFPVAATGCKVLETKSPTEDYIRCVMHAKIMIKEHELFVFNTHLSWKPDEGQIRESQTGELVDYVEEVAGVSEAILMGDLNAAPNSAEIKKLLVQGKFNDTYRAIHPKEAGLTWDNQNPYAKGHQTKLPDRRIDYIMTRNPGRILGKLDLCDVVFTEPDKQGVYASDHFGLFTSFEEKTALVAKESE